MRALFKSKNLLGDGLNIAPALRKWCSEQVGYWSIDLLTNCDPNQEIYTRMGLKTNNGEIFVSVIYDEKQLREPYNFNFNFDVSEAFRIGHEKHLHITECYADMLGVEISEFTPTFVPTEEEHEKDLILLSLFSKSCASNQGLPPNKMLPWKKVEPFLEYFRQFGKVGILGGPNDRAPIEASEDEYYTGMSLNKVALMLRDCKFLFTIDNGISHLAASQKTKSIVLYPACLDLRWIAPRGNENAFIIQIDPNTVHTVGLKWQVNEIMQYWKIKE